MLSIVDIHPGDHLTRSNTVNREVRRWEDGIVVETREGYTYVKYIVVLNDQGYCDRIRYIFLHYLYYLLTKLRAEV
jgi:hypothetical protein